MPDDVPDFVARVTARLMAGEGDLLPVSALPVDGTFPTGTARYEKRAIAQEIPIWDPDICIDCGKCAIVCPHATIRMKVFEPSALDGAPPSFKSKEFRSKDISGYRMTIQVAPDDCTGCGVCVDVCPAKSKTEVRHKSINMEPALAHRDAERPAWDFFLSIPELDRDLLPHDSVKGSQALQPLFEFSGACAGCGETPYLKLATQLFGDRMVVANATGCSSIYGGNLPTTPWTVNADGRGPAWSNSLFEDNAEFGLGLRLGLEAQTALAHQLLERVADAVGPDLVAGHPVRRPAVRGRDPCPAGTGRRAARRPANRWPRRTATPAPPPATCWRWPAACPARACGSSAATAGPTTSASAGSTTSCRRDATSTSSCSTPRSTRTPAARRRRRPPRGAVAKFAAAGKASGKKDLGAIARAYGNVYVAEIAIGANDLQATKALLEADAWPGPSLVIAYSTCIAHGIDMSKSMSHQKDAVKSGYWPLYRFQPSEAEHGIPFKLDSHEPSIPVADFIATEARFAVLARTHPERAEHLAPARPSRRRRAVALLQPARRDGAHGRPRHAEHGRRPADAGDRGGAERCPALDTTYLGLDLRSPIVASAGPLTGDPDTAARLADAGAGALGPAVVVRGGDRPRAGRAHVGAARPGAEHFAEAIDYFPALARVPRAHRTATWPTSNASRLGVAVPVIASLNAFSPGGWVRYARLLGDAGADAIELNVYRVAADPTRSAPLEVEDDDLALVADVTSRRRRPGRRQAVARSTRRWPTSPSEPSRRGPTGSSCSTASTSPISTSTRSRSCLASSCRRPGSCACRCAGSPSSGRCSTDWPASPPPAASRPEPTSPRHSLSVPTSP